MTPKGISSILIILIIVGVLAIGGGIYWYLLKSSVNKNSGNQGICEKSGGAVSNITECNGEISQICTFPSGQSCYVENVKDGKCIGIFSPKVLCDTVSPTNKVNVPLGK
jgi:hypothetical protein